LVHSANLLLTLSLSGFLQQLTAERLGPDPRLSQSMSTAYLTADGAAGSNVSYRVSGRAYHDGVFDQAGNYPTAVVNDMRNQAQLRDAYIDLSLGRFDFRLGNQQIVWGEALGTFVADVVNARDYRWFILPEFSQMRIPEWAATAEYSAGESHVEAICIPVAEFDKLGLPGSEFPAPVPLTPGFVPVSAPTVEPSKRFENAEYGGRLSHTFGGLDVSVFGLRTWDKTPALARTLSGGTETFYPEYRRLDVGGLTASKDFRGWVLHEEFVYNHGKYFSVIDPNSPDGLVQRDYADYLLALDHEWGDRLTTDLQVSQRAIFKYQSDIFQQDRLRTTVSLDLAGSFDNGWIRPSCLVAVTPSKGKIWDTMVRPKLTWRASQRLSIAVGADLFFGPPDGIFGEYADRSRAFTEATLYF
jgi:hypothetical protein